MLYFQTMCVVSCKQSDVLYKQNDKFYLAYKTNRCQLLFYRTSYLRWGMVDICYSLCSVGMYLLDKHRNQLKFGSGIYLQNRLKMRRMKRFFSFKINHSTNSNHDLTFRRSSLVFSLASYTSRDHSSARAKTRKLLEIRNNRCSYCVFPVLKSGNKQCGNRLGTSCSNKNQYRLFVTSLLSSTC